MSDLMFSFLLWYAALLVAVFEACSSEVNLVLLHIYGICDAAVIEVIVSATSVFMCSDTPLVPLHFLPSSASPWHLSCAPSLEVVQLH